MKAKLSVGKVLFLQLQLSTQCYGRAIFKNRSSMRDFQGWPGQGSLGLAVPGLQFEFIITQALPGKLKVCLRPLFPVGLRSTMPLTFPCSGSHGSRLTSAASFKVAGSRSSDPL